MPILKEHRLKLSAPLVLTVFVILWTFAVQPFTSYGDNWALWPVLFALPIALGLHILLLTTLSPKWPLVGYALLHLTALLCIAMICLMRISKDSL